MNQWTAVGYKAAYLNPNNAGDVVAVGYEAEYTGPGANDVAIGYQALYSGSAGSSVAVGYQAAKYPSSSGGGNTAAGANALGTTASAQASPNSGSYHTAIGAYALQNLQGAGTDNMALGYDAGGSITTGASNTVIGYQVASTTLTTGSHNILIGTTSAVDTLTATTSNFVSIGNLYEGDANVGHVVFNGSTPTDASGAPGAAPPRRLPATTMSGIVTIKGTGDQRQRLPVTFANSWTTAPVCVAQDQTTGNLLEPPMTTTALTLNRRQHAHGGR